MSARPGLERLCLACGQAFVPVNHLLCSDCQTKANADRRAEIADRFPRFQVGAL